MDATTFARSRAMAEAEARRIFPAAIIFRASVIFGVGDSFFNELGSLLRVLPVMPLFGLYAAHLIVQRPSLRQTPRYLLIGAALSVLLLGAIWLRQLVFVDLGRITAAFGQLVG